MTSTWFAPSRCCYHSQITPLPFSGGPSTLEALSRKSINILKALEITKSRKHIKFDLTCIDFVIVDDECVQYFILDFITISFSSCFHQFKENSNVHDGVHEQYGQASCQYPSSKIYVPIQGLSYSLCMYWALPSLHHLYALYFNQHVSRLHLSQSPHR